MREMLYKKRESLRKRRKAVAIREQTEDEDCKTHVRKSFVYKITCVQHIKKVADRPEVRIKKEFYTQSKEEKFSFRVKGTFYMTRNKVMLKVDFCHTLRININWKDEAFSPKKSVTLT